MKLEATVKIERLWSERPGLVRTFLEKRRHWERLATEVSYTLAESLKMREIQYSYVSSRAKKLESFAEKMDRKNYSSPLDQITDLAGARVVYLYPSDRPRIEKAIEEDFEVIERVEKTPGQDSQFGYMAMHFLVKLGPRSSGARYDDIKHLICEIQVRTVLQDSWAVLDHHLSYKQGSDVPEQLKSQLHSLSDFLRKADENFDHLRAQRLEYQEGIRRKRDDTNLFLDEEANMDTVLEYLNLRFPEMQTAGSDHHLSSVLGLANEVGYRSLTEIDQLLKRTRAAREALNERLPTRYACNHIHRAVGLVHPELRNDWFSDQQRELITELESQVVPAEIST